MKSLKQKIEVMQAAEDGKDIEIKGTKLSGDYWHTNSEYCWDWANFDYRIKPEPIEFWVNVYSGHTGSRYATKETAESNAEHGVLRTIKMQEVTE